MNTVNIYSIDSKGNKPNEHTQAPSLGILVRKHFPPDRTPLVIGQSMAIANTAQFKQRHLILVTILLSPGIAGIAN